MASEAIEYVRDRPTPRLEEFDLADLVDEVGITLQEQGEDADPNLLRNWVNAPDAASAGCAPIATCSIACSSISAAMPSTPAPAR